MHIELIGCTSAGKSSLSQKLLANPRQAGYELITSYDFVLRWARFGWLRNHKARMVILNMVALIACLLAWPRRRALYRFIAGTILRLPGHIRPAEKLKIVRIAARNIGIDEIIRRNRAANQVILADEGMLHIASYLFVHVTQPPNFADLVTFLRLVALPELVVYIEQPEAVLVTRTIRKGHKRIPGGAPHLVEAFIRHSIDLFDRLAADPNVQARLLTIRGGEMNTSTAAEQENPRITFVRQIFSS